MIAAKGASSSDTVQSVQWRSLTGGCYSSNGIMNTGDDSCCADDLSVSTAINHHKQREVTVNVASPLFDLRDKAGASIYVAYVMVVHYALFVRKLSRKRAVTSLSGKLKEA